MECNFKQMIFPKKVSEPYLGYMIALYTPVEKLLDSSGLPVSEVKVVGHCLPTVDGLRFNLFGKWKKTEKHGTQFELESFEEIIQPTREGIIAYLSSGVIKGIDPKTAERIYTTFGEKTLDVLDNSPEDFINVRGVNKSKLSKIIDSYLASRSAHSLLAFLAPHGVTVNQAVKIYSEYGQAAIEIVRDHPYQLCDMVGIEFHTADAIARSMGLNPLSHERIGAGLIQTQKMMENKGHLCLDAKTLVTECVKLLETKTITPVMVCDVGKELLTQNRLIPYGDYLFRESTAKAESEVAQRVCEFLDLNDIKYRTNLDTAIDALQRSEGIVLAAEQRNAVKTCLTSYISIITGGPGTGKTLVQRFLLKLYENEHPGAKIVCCAPTGRAARRMEQCTGRPASTIHKALGLLADDDGCWAEPEMLDADLALVDEVSMMDIYLARNLLKSLPPGCQLILVGDSDQLPSVGPGAVLSELISCRAIPVVKLDKVYRQNAGSRIALNASLIRHNTVSLEYGSDFVLHESKSFEHSAELIETLYLEETAALGVDNVALLTPFKVKTATGSLALNERIRARVNPPANEKAEITHIKRLFREGDKVMQNKNRGDINNGDIGYIKRILKADGDSSVFVEFEDGRNTEYDVSDLDLLELAYASTIHKSQGSEYQTVIINIQLDHHNMLKRPLLYTAITRAKQKVIIVGERKALVTAIDTVDAEKRGTQLAARIINDQNKKIINERKS